jgi:5-methylcytosine-specific restriction endonuclease McrA
LRFEPAPKRDAISDFTTVRSAKTGWRKTWLAKIALYVHARYCLYYATATALEALPKRRWSSKGRNALIHCYEGSTNDWNAMRTGFLASLTPTARAICPYCLIREPESWDHFLPKEQFPEFSVLLANLVYVCGRCNRKKGEYLVGQPRQVLNPYFDAIPTTVPLLYAGAAIIGGAPKLHFMIAGPPPIPAPLVQLAQRHFDAFELQPKLISAGGAYLATLVDELVARYAQPIGQPMLTEELDIRLDGLLAASANDWRVALLDSLKVCNGLVDYINDRIAAKPTAPLRQPRPPRDPTFQVLAALAAAGP